MLQKYRDFRYLFSGRLISNCGDSIYMLVLSWYILEVTNSTMLVGVLNSIIFLPNLFAFLFGKMIDRWNKKRTLILLELVQLVAVLVIMLGMALHTQAKTMSLIIIFIGVFVASTASLNTYTVQDAFVPSVVKKMDLPKAEMYMSFAYNGTDYVFTALTGFLIAVMSYMSLLIVDIMTFIISIITFSHLSSQTKSDSDVENDMVLQIDEKRNIWSGFQFLLADKMLFMIATGGALANFMFGGLNVYTLTIGKSFGGASYFGLLTGSSSVGVLIGGTVVVNFVLKHFKVGRALWMADIIFGICLIPISMITNKYLLLIFWVFAFTFLGVNQVVQKPILQAEIPHEKMGEVLSAYSTITISTLSIGSLFFGYIGKYVNWQIFIVMFGIVYMLIGLTYCANKRLHNYSVDD